MEQYCATDNLLDNHANNGSGHQRNSGWYDNRSQWLGDSWRQTHAAKHQHGYQRNDRPNTLGQYRFLFLNPGTYRLSVEMAGFLGL